MSWSQLLAEATDARTFPLLIAAIVVLPLLRVLLPEEQRRRRGIALTLVLHLIMVPIAAAFRDNPGTSYRDVHLLARLFGTATFVLMGAALLFLLILPRAHVRAPRIVQDVVTATVLAVTALALASSAGIEVAGLIATSAVVTAVIGLSLQDTLGNVFAGLALQADDSIRIGDWIKVGESSGKVIEMRWRYTAIETRNWETLFIPNSVITKANVLVLGRRTGQPLQWRRWIYFNVDFRYQPTDVCECVRDALVAAPIQDVSTEPAPQCILMGFEQSYARYAVRYWLLDIARDDPTDSVVRTRIYFALKRQGIPMSIPAAALFMTKETSRRRQEKSAADGRKRREVIDAVPLFHELAEADRNELAKALRYAPFARGETMTREGAEAHWLYIVIEGEASIRVTSQGGAQIEVGHAGPGKFFGEMSLMTGAPRAATVVALTDVECYRLDSQAFQRILERRPELLESLAVLLAERSLEIERARKQSGVSTPAQLTQAKTDLLAKMQRFFGL